MYLNIYVYVYYMCCVCEYMFVGVHVLDVPAHVCISAYEAQRFYVGYGHLSALLSESPAEPGVYWFGLNW